MDSERRFRRAVLESPSDVTPRLIYADWLEEYKPDPETDALVALIRSAAGLIAPINMSRFRLALHRWLMTALDIRPPEQLEVQWPSEPNMGKGGETVFKLRNSPGIDPGFEHEVYWHGGFIERLVTTKALLHRSGCLERLFTTQPIQSVRLIDFCPIQVVVGMPSVDYGSGTISLAGVTMKASAIQTTRSESRYRLGSSGLPWAGWPSRVTAANLADPLDVGIAEYWSSRLPWEVWRHVERMPNATPAADDLYSNGQCVDFRSFDQANDALSLALVNWQRAWQDLPPLPGPEISPMRPSARTLSRHRLNPLTGARVPSDVRRQVSPRTIME